MGKILNIFKKKPKKTWHEFFEEKSEGDKKCIFCKKKDWSMAAHDTYKIKNKKENAYFEVVLLACKNCGLVLSFIKSYLEKECTK